MKRLLILSFCLMLLITLVVALMRKVGEPQTIPTEYIFVPSQHGETKELCLLEICLGRTTLEQAQPIFYQHENFFGNITVDVQMETILWEKYGDTVWSGYLNATVPLEQLQSMSQVIVSAYITLPHNSLTLGNAINVFGSPTKVQKCLHYRRGHYILHSVVWFDRQVAITIEQSDPKQELVRLDPSLPVSVIFYRLIDREAFYDTLPDWEGFTLPIEC